MPNADPLTPQDAINDWINRVQPPLMIVHSESTLAWNEQTQHVLRNLIGLQQQGHQVYLLCPADAALHHAAKARYIPVVTLPIGAKNLGGVIAMRQWLTRHQPDILHTHSSADSWLGALACLTLSEDNYKVPQLIRTRHVSTPIRPNRPTQWLYGTAACYVITIGESLRQTLLSQNLVSPYRCINVATSANHRVFKPIDKLHARTQLGLHTLGRYIGIPADLDVWQGHLNALDAFKQLCQHGEMNDVDLIILGDGSQRRVIEHYIRDHQLVPRVHLIEQPLNDAQLAYWLNALDMVVLPLYAHDCLPHAMIAAMMCGIPVISCTTGSVEDVLRDQVTGLLVPPQDSMALYSAMMTLLNHPLHALQLGQQARHFVLQHHTQDGLHHKLSAVYQAALHNDQALSLQQVQQHSFALTLQEATLATSPSSRTQSHATTARHFSQSAPQSTLQPIKPTVLTSSDAPSNDVANAPPISFDATHRDMTIPPASIAAKQYESTQSNYIG
jgi:glycosyltransferase involved in cell wall biosynthesis